MNATFGKVLRKVLTGLFIMEPNMKRSRIRGRCPKMKRVPRQSGFALGYHVQSIREREREKEGEIEKHNHNKVPTRKERVPMHEKCINM